MNTTDIHKARDAVAARSQSIRLRSKLKKGVPFNPTPLQAWRQAADDVAFNRPVKEKLVKLRSATSASAVGDGVFSYGNLSLSEFEVRVISNSLRRAISFSVYRAPLVDLDLTRCDLDVKKSGFLGKGLAGNTTIERLTLRCNDLTADGAELIIRGILDSFSLMNSTDEYDEWGRRLDRVRGVNQNAGVLQREINNSDDARRQRDLDAQRRAAQVSPFIDETARHLVTGIGYAPVTPSGPDGAIPVRGLTAGGAVPASSNYVFRGPETTTDLSPSTEFFMSHTQKVFSAKLDPFSTNDQLRNVARAEGGSSAAAQTLARNTRPGSSGIVSFQALQVKSGLTKEELVGKSDQFFEKYLQHEARAQLTGIPVALDGGESLAQSSIESADPTDPNIAKRQPYLHNPLNMYGPGGDLVPSGIYPNGLPEHPPVPFISAQGKYEQLQKAPFIPLPPVEDDEEGPGIAYSPQFPQKSRLHPLKYLNLVSTLLTIGSDRIETALDIKQIGCSDSRALNALADLVSHPLCGLQNLNISKNRLDARCCEKLWVCLDLNKSLEVVGMHNTQAGPVVAAGFVAKALGLSIAHGRAALTDERLGVIWAPTKSGFESTLERKAVEETTLGYFQGLSMGNGGKWDQKYAEKKPIEISSNISQPPLKEKSKLTDMDKLLHDAKSVFQDHSSLAMDSSFRSDVFEIPLHPQREGIAFGDEPSVAESIMPGPSSILGWRSFSSIPENPHRHGYDEEGRNASKKASSVFWERVHGISKLNLSTCALGDVGILGISALLMAARRSDEVVRGRLRQKHKIAAESMKRWRESGGTEAGFLAAASKAAGVGGDARSINRVPLHGSKSSGVVADHLSGIDKRFGLSSISSVNESGDVSNSILAAGSALAFAKQRNKLSDTSKDPDALLSASGGPLMSFAGGADEDAEKLSVPFAAATGLTGLEWLKLRSNEIGPKAISSLCRSLRTSLSLRILDLSHNPIGVLGAFSLADALAHPHCTLQELFVDSCRITHGGDDLSGAHALLRSLYVNRSVTRLSMKANTLVPQELKFARGWEHQGITYSLRQLFGENRTLQVLDLRDNFIHKAGQMACADAVSSFPYIVPNATVVASILTRWLDENLTRFHSRPPPGGMTMDSSAYFGKKSKSTTPAKFSAVSALHSSQQIKPHFPTVEELLMRPPSTAPVASIYAALDSDEAIAIVSEADKRNHREKVELDALKDNTKLRHESRKMKKRKMKDEGQAVKLPDASVLLHAVHMAHQAERHETTFPTANDAAGTTRSGTAASLASEQQRQREEREVAAIAAAVSAARPKRDPEVQKIIALGNLLAASKSGIGASQRALEFLQQSEPVWVKDHEEFVKQMNIEKERKRQSNQLSHVMPESSPSGGTQRVISTSESNLSDITHYSRGSPISLIFGGKAGDGRTGRAASRESPPSTSAPLITPKLKLIYPRVVLRGSTDNAEGRALARIIRDSTSRQIARRSQGTVLSAMSGLGSISSSLSNAFASAGNLLASSESSESNDRNHVQGGIEGSNVSSMDVVFPRNSDSTIMTTDSSVVPTGENRQRTSSRKGKKNEASPEALSAVGKFVNDNVVPVADRDYVIVRGSRLTLEVAIPKLDFTRLSYYGGISPQNAFFDAQKGKDDVIEAFEVRQKKLGIPPPFALPKASEVLLAASDHSDLLAPRKAEDNEPRTIVSNDFTDTTSSEPDFSLAAPRGAMRRQASLREILAATSKASRNKAGHNVDDDSDDNNENLKKESEDLEIDGFAALEGAPPRLSEIFAASLREKELAIEKHRRELEDAEALRQKENTRQRAIRKDAQRRRQKENHDKLRNARLGRFPPPLPISAISTLAPTLIPSIHEQNANNDLVTATPGISNSLVGVDPSLNASLTDVKPGKPQNSFHRAAILFDSSKNSSADLSNDELFVVPVNKADEKTEDTGDHFSKSSSDSEKSDTVLDLFGTQPSLRTIALDLPSSLPMDCKDSFSSKTLHSSPFREVSSINDISSHPVLTIQPDELDKHDLDKRQNVEDISNHASDGFITASEHSDYKSQSESETIVFLSHAESVDSRKVVNSTNPTIDNALVTAKGILPPRALLNVESSNGQHQTSVIRSEQVLASTHSRLEHLNKPSLRGKRGSDKAPSSDDDSGGIINSSFYESSDQHSSGDDGPKVATSFEDPRILYDPVSADGSRRIVDSRSLIPIDVRNLTSLPRFPTPHEDVCSSSEEIQGRDFRPKRSPSYKNAAKSKLRPGQYTKMDLTITTRKMVTPANAIPLISMRRGEMLRDSLATGVSSLVHLRGNVIRRVFDFLGEERKCLV